MGYVIGGILDPLEPMLPRPVMQIMAYLAFQMAAPMISLLAVFPAMLLGSLALRIGWAGWIMSIALPAMIAGIVGICLGLVGDGQSAAKSHDFTALLVTSGAVHGITAWLLLRWRRPAALAPRRI